MCSFQFHSYDVNPWDHRAVYLVGTVRVRVRQHWKSGSTILYFGISGIELNKPFSSSIRDLGVRTILKITPHFNGRVGQERLGPFYFFISLVLGPLNSLVWYVTSLRYTRGLGWRIHCGVENTESNTNKQHIITKKIGFR